MVGKVTLSFLVAILLFASPSVWASQNGPVFFVDDDNSPSDDCDGDFHFHSIAAVFATLNNPNAFPKLDENDTIVVDPGNYSTSVTYAAGECQDINATSIDISKKGVVLEAPEGRDLTKFAGQIIISAKEVRVIGLDVDATGQSSAFLVLNDNVLLDANKAHNASEAGIVVDEGSDNVTVTNNEVFNNGTDGVFVRGDSDGTTISTNQIRSNGAIGVLVYGASDRAVVQDNKISLNQSEGVKVQDSDFAEVENNDVTNNALDGIRFEDANDGVINNNTISSSGGYGIALVDSDSNEVSANSTTNNDGGGVALRGSEHSSKRNLILQNTITDNIRAGSEGVLLEGDVTSNTIQGNTINNNSFGVRFKTPSSGSSPSNNTIDNNTIQDSPEDGIEILGSEGRNTIKANTLSGNNKAGIRVVNFSGNDEFKNNKIFNNGHQGILIDGSPRNTVQANEITNNGREGIALTNGAVNNNVLDNIVKDNRSQGIAATAGANGNDIETNTVSGNRQNGIMLDGVEKVDVRGNTVERNVARGLAIENSNGIDVEHNKVTRNNTGGVWIRSSVELDIEQNNIFDNTEFGLAVDQEWPAPAVMSENLKADRNWWGASRGPAGVYEGNGNAVLGVHVEHIFPWLTAKFEYLTLGTTSGEIFDDFGAGNQSEFVAMDKADIDISFFNIDAEEDGIVIVSKFDLAVDSEKPAELEQLPGAIKAISLLVSGLNSGDTVLSVQFTDEELNGVNKDILALHYWDGSNWVQLNSRSFANINLVEGELSVETLRNGVVLAVAPGGN